MDEIEREHELWICNRCEVVFRPNPPDIDCPTCRSGDTRVKARYTSSNNNDEYGKLLTLFSNGRRDYYNLTRTYVTGNSLLITSIAFLINALVTGDIPFLALIITIICFLGLWLCFNLKIAQERLSTYNAYWERELRILEKKTTSIISRPYFTRLLDFETKKGVIEAEDSEQNFKISPWIKSQIHTKFHARRMKLFPVIFGLIYGLISIFCISFFISHLPNVALTREEVVPIITFMIVGGIFGWLIIHYLKPEQYLERGGVSAHNENEESEDEEELLQHDGSNESTKDLEHQLFFGLVFSLALLFISFPSIGDMSSFFSNFVGVNEAVYTSQLVKTLLFSCLILSSLTRYYGAVKNNTNYIIYSLILLICGLQGVIHIVIYKIFWTWLGDININFIIAIPTVMLIFNLFFISNYEISWMMFYTNKKPERIITDYFSALNLWAFLSIVFGVVLAMYIPLRHVTINLLIFLSAFISLIFAYFLPKFRVRAS